MLRWAKTNKIQPRALTDDEPIGGWNRVKRYFIRKWTEEIQLSSRPTDAEIGLVPIEGGVAEALEETMETAVGAVGVEVTPPERPGFGRLDEDGDMVPEATFEGRISGVMVEERRDTGELVTEDRTQGDEDLKLQVPKRGKGGSTKEEN